MQEESRKYKRRRALKQGRIIVDDIGSVRDCTIRDISPTGARVRFSAPITLPPESELLFVVEMMRISVKVIWCAGNEAGLEFRKEQSWIEATKNR